MKKSLIALAAASAFAAPAFAATSNVDVYGRVHFAVEDVDTSGSDMEVRDRVSYFGIKGTEDVGGGLKAIWQIEYQLNASNYDGPYTVATTSGSAFSLRLGQSTLRNTYVGLSGGFGTVLLGRHDTPYKLGTTKLDPFADTLGDYNSMPDGVALIDATQDYRSPQAMAYISPTWNGFHFAVAAVATNNALNLDNDDSVDATSATAIYENGPLYASASYQKVEVLDSTAWKIGGGYAFGDVKVGAIYESVDKYNGTNDRDSWLINGIYTMGPIAIKAEYGQADVNNVDQDAWALGLDYNLSKRTTAYVMYATGDNDSGDDVSGFAVGMKHSF